MKEINDVMLKVRVPAELKRRFELVCHQEHITPSQAIRTKMREFIEGVELAERRPYTRRLESHGQTDNREKHLSAIRNEYWQLRQLREFDQAGRRRLYRRIKEHKDALLADGFDAETLRLYCRQYASLDTAAKARYQAHTNKDLDQ